MISLRQAVARKGSSGEALPQVFASLTAIGVRLRRGQLAMLASAPNAGKSMTALVMAIRMQVPTLYFSADTDAHDSLLRAAAHVTGETLDGVEAGMEADADRYLGHLDSLRHISWCFDPGPTLEDIDLELQAYIEVQGEPPALIVIDNLINVSMDDADEFRGLRLIMAALHHLARESGACVLVLHHVTGEFDGTDKPPPRRALHGKVAHLPEVILTLAGNGAFIGIACVKNRSGASDPQALNPVWLKADFERAQITDATH